MAELVYAFDLKSNGAIRTGSSPVPATIFFYPKYSIALVAAIEPSEAAVTNCLKSFVRTSPATNTPGTEVLQPSSEIT